jgi:hypothetical protein
MGGSSRWKQRAYNDLLRDISSRILDVPVLRISIFDTFDGHKVNDLLLKEREEEMLAMIEEMISVAV